MNLGEKNQFWVGLLLIWISHFCMDFMLGVWPVYKTLAHIDVIVAGFIASAGLFLGEGLQLYFGLLSDKGYHKVLLALGVGLSASIPFLSYVQNEWILFVLILSACVGSGAFHPSGSGLVLGFSNKFRSSFIAFFACGGMLGAALSQISYTYFYQQFEGKTWFLILPVFFCTICCALFSFPSLKTQTKNNSFKEVIKAIKPQKNMLGLLYLIHILLQIVLLSFTFFLPDILQAKGYEEWFCFGGGYFCFIMGSFATSIPIGYLVDKIGYRHVLSTIVFASACLIYFFLAVESLTLVQPILLLFLLGGTLGVVIPVVVAGGTQHVPAHTRSFVSALYMGGTTCIAGWGPIIASLIAAYFGQKEAPTVTAIQILSSLFIISLVLIYYLPQPHILDETEMSNRIPVREGDGPI